MSAGFALTLGQLVADRYRIDAVLGEGGMGIVYRGTRVADAMPVAIKLLNADAFSRPDLRRRFAREASALAALSHPNIIGVLEFGEIGPSLFLVMELLAGQSLGDVLSNHVLDPSTALQIADQLLAGLAFVHAHGVLHRDVKPDNVFLATLPNGSTLVKLLDFGLVKFTDRDAWASHSTLTEQGAILGSPPYMPPEQIFGGEVDARTDVYAAGAVLFELLTGRWPFEGEEVSDLFRAHALDPVPSLALTRTGLGVRPELEAVVQKAMAKTQPQRFADAREMRTALARVPKPAAWLIA